MSTQVKIAAIGTYLPENRESNYAKAEKFGYDKSFLENKLGFTSIALKNKEETTLDMCLQAFNDLKGHIDDHFKHIQLVTVVTQNPTLQIPHTSAMLHNALELDKNCMTFDISQGCAGYCHALQIVKALMDTLRIDNALLFTCDSYRSIIDEEDRNVSMIFGDGASATLLSREVSEGYEITDAIFGTAFNSHDCLIIENDKLMMEGSRVFQHAAEEVPHSIQLLLNRNNISKEDVDLFLFHQGSKFIVDSLTKLMRIEANKTEFSASEYGNTVSSSIPILLAGYFGTRAKSKVILSGFGVGFTWGNCLLEYIKN